MSTQSSITFADLGLAEAVLRAVHEIGYESPSQIQAEAIPPLLAGRDLLGQAQTGTGKTAAFALPLLSRLDLSRREPQVLVLTPTRELAIQVAEAMQTYARHLPGFHVLPVYGGQGMDMQLRHLARGVHVVVGTPGRVLDHLRRGTLKLAGLSAVVLDEADEMLRMGFIDDVTGILEQAPVERQVALFSATMPAAIAGIARSHLRDPAEIRIASRTATVATVNQRCWQVTGVHKLDALTRILEVEDFDAMLVFVRTRNQTVELAERLEARGYAAAAINGDMPQAQRERTVDRLKRGLVDVLVATDVAARGLDVERISHVLNFDIPHDIEAYVHRIGRTGRAGRAGQAILFVQPRERRMLRAIEQATRQPIIAMRLPSSEDVSDRRTSRFKQLVTETLESEDLAFFEEVVSGYLAEHDVALADVAAALAFLAQRERPLRTPADGDAKRPAARPASARADGRDVPARPAAAVTPSPVTPPSAPPVLSAQAAESVAPPEAQSTAVASDPSADGEPTLAPPRKARAPRPARAPALVDGESQAAPVEQDEPVPPPRTESTHRKGKRATDAPGRGRRGADAARMVRYRIEVGAAHGAEARNIVGAIANEAGLDREFIGRVDIHAEHSIVELPDGMPKPIFNHLRSVWVSGRQLRLRRDDTPAVPRAVEVPPASSAGPAVEAEGASPAEPVTSPAADGGADIATPTPVDDGGSTSLGSRGASTGGPGGFFERPARFEHRDGGSRPERAGGKPGFARRDGPPRGGAGRPGGARDGDRPRGAGGRFERKDGDSRPERARDAGGKPGYARRDGPPRGGAGRPGGARDGDRPRGAGGRFERKDGDSRPERARDAGGKPGYARRDGPPRGGPGRSGGARDGDRPRGAGGRFERKDGDTRPGSARDASGKPGYARRDGPPRGGPGRPGGARDGDRPRGAGGRFERKDGDSRPERARDASGKPGYARRDGPPRGGPGRPGGARDGDRPRGAGGRFERKAGEERADRPRDPNVKPTFVRRGGGSRSTATGTPPARPTLHTTGARDGKEDDKGSTRPAGRPGFKRPGSYTGTAAGARGPKSRKP